MKLTKNGMNLDKNEQIFEKKFKAEFIAIQTSTKIDFEKLTEDILNIRKRYPKEDIEVMCEDSEEDKPYRIDKFYYSYLFGELNGMKVISIERERKYTMHEE